MRYVWEFHPNQEIATLHVDVPLPEGAKNGLFDFASDRAKMDPEGIALAEKIVGIKGVVSARVGGREVYKATITRGRVFPWPEVCPRVVAEIADHFGIEAVEEAEPPVRALANG